jgi:hypothetical protein
MTIRFAEFDDICRFEALSPPQLISEKPFPDYLYKTLYQFTNSELIDWIAFTVPRLANNVAIDSRIIDAFFAFCNAHTDDVYFHPVGSSIPFVDNPLDDEDDDSELEYRKEFVALQLGDNLRWALVVVDHEEKCYHVFESTPQSTQIAFPTMDCPIFRNTWPLQQHAAINPGDIGIVVCALAVTLSRKCYTLHWTADIDQWRKIIASTVYAIMTGRVT